MDIATRQPWNLKHSAFNLPLCILHFAFCVVFSSSAAWRYDPAANVISDDAAWTTKVTRAVVTVNGRPVTNLTISAWNKGAGAFDLTTFAADTGCHVVAVGEKAFGNSAASTACQTITSFTGPEVTSLGSRAFGYCQQLTAASFAAGLKTIGSYAFYYATRLASFEPQYAPSLTSLGQESFRSCSALVASFHFPLPTALAARTFQDCPKLKDVRLPSVTSCNGQMHFYRDTALTNVLFSARCTKFTTDSFGSCTALQRIDPFVAKNVGNHFDGGDFTGLNKLQGPFVLDSPNVTVIGQSCFNNCRKISDFYIDGDNIATIGTYAFRELTGGSRIWWMGKKAPTSTIGSQTYTVASGNYIRIYVKNGQDTEGWRNYCTYTAENIPASYRNRGDYPGRRTIGLIAENNSFAWVVRWSQNERTMLTLD